MQPAFHRSGTRVTHPLYVGEAVALPLHPGGIQDCCGIAIDDAGRIQRRPRQRPLGHVLVAAAEFPLALRTDLINPFVLVDDRRWRVTDRTVPVEIVPFDRRFFEPDTRDDRPDQLVTGAAEFVARLELAHVVTSELVEVVIELTGVSNTDLGSEFGKGNSIARLERLVAIPEGK